MTRYGTLRNPTLTETADRCDTHTRIPSVFTAEPSPARLPPALAPSAAAPATSCYYLPALADAGDSAAAAAAEGDGAGAAAAPAAAPPKWRGAGGRSWNTQRRKVRGVRQVVRVESSVSETKNHDKGHDTDRKYTLIFATTGRAQEGRKRANMLCSAHGKPTKKPIAVRITRHSPRDLLKPSLFKKREQTHGENADGSYSSDDWSK